MRPSLYGHHFTPNIFPVCPNEYQINEEVLESIKTKTTESMKKKNEGNLFVTVVRVTLVSLWKACYRKHRLHSLAIVTQKTKKNAPYTDEHSTVRKKMKLLYDFFIKRKLVT